MLQFFFMNMEMMLPHLSTKELQKVKRVVPSSDQQENSSNPSEDSKSQRFRCKKEKRIRKKADSIIDKLRIQNPVPFGHVFNFLNLLGINEKALITPNNEESYFKSIFYIKTVEKVEVRKNAVIIQLHQITSSQSTSERMKIEQLANRLSTSGNPQLYLLALQMQETFRKLEGLSVEKQVQKKFDNEPLSRHIQRLQDKVYMCKVGSNKLVISRALLQLLEEDLQNYALELVKFKTPRQEIISNNNYISVLTKTVSNIGLLCDFLKEEIDFDTLFHSSVFEFEDHLITRKKKKIPCKLRLSMLTPMLTCLQAIEVSNSHTNIFFEEKPQEKRKLLDSEIRDLRFRECQSLRHIVQLQRNMLSENKLKTAGYLPISRKTK